MEGFVSVIIPSYNRYGQLLDAIKSVKAQTYKHLEIIIVNDASTQPEYYTDSFEGCKVVHLDVNTKQKFGFVALGYIRNQGIAISNGQYLAFLDDDDIWMPTKLEVQLNHMKQTGCKMSCTEGYFGIGVYDSTKKYPLFNSEQFRDVIKYYFACKGKEHLLWNGYPYIWNREFLQCHNCAIVSSVMVEKDTMKQIDYFNNSANIATEDYTCWLNVLTLTNAVYISEPLFYYNGDTFGKEHCK